MCPGKNLTPCAQLLFLSPRTAKDFSLYHKFESLPLVRQRKLMLKPFNYLCLLLPSMGGEEEGSLCVICQWLKAAFVNSSFIVSSKESRTWFIFIRQWGQDTAAGLNTDMFIYVYIYIYKYWAWEGSVTAESKERKNREMYCRKPTSINPSGLTFWKQNSWPSFICWGNRSEPHLQCTEELGFILSHSAGCPFSGFYSHNARFHVCPTNL